MSKYIIQRKNGLFLNKHIMDKMNHWVLDKCDAKKFKSKEDAISYAVKCHLDASKVDIVEN